MPVIEISGSKLYFSLSGCGPKDILLVHGSGGDHTIWGYQVKELRKDFSIAAIDLNGHGRSAFREGDGLETYTQDVLAVLERLSPDTFLVGHSLGGAIVLNVALHYPDRISGLGLIGSGAKLRVLPKILELISQDFEGAIDLILSWAFKAGTHPKLLQKAKEQMHRNGQKILLRDLLTCDAFDVMNKLNQIKVPALIICGREDKLTPVKYSEYLQTHISPATLQVIEEAGHMVMLEQPGELNRVIKEFVNKLYD